MAQRTSYTDTNAAYSQALADALAHLRTLLANPSSRSWKHLAPTPLAPAPTGLSSSSTSTNAKAKAKAKGKGRDSDHPDFVNGLAHLDPSHVRVHRRADKLRGHDILRAVADVPCDPLSLDLDAVRAVLATPETRSHWDSLVDSAATVSLLDPLTRILKTDYRLGWPASPRDTITISRTFPAPDASSLIDLATSLPRAADEPAFLRPAPPFVRANVHLVAWCFQIVPPSALPSSPDLPTSSSSALSASPSGPSSPAHTDTHRLRITLFWQWSLRLPTPLAPSSAPLSAHLAPLLAALVAHLRAPAAAALPLLSGYGRGVELNRDEYDPGSEMRSVEYAVVAEPEPVPEADPGAGAGTDRGVEDDSAGEDDEAVGGNLQGLDELARRRARARLARAIELSLPALGVPVPPPLPLPLPLEPEPEPELRSGFMSVSSADAPPPVPAPAGANSDGWDIRIALTPLGGAPTAPPYTATVALLPPRRSSAGASDGAGPEGHSRAARLALTVRHAPLAGASALVRVSVTVQRLAGARAVRVNGARVEVGRAEPPPPRAGQWGAPTAARAWELTAGMGMGMGTGTGTAAAPGVVEDDRASVRTGTSAGDDAPPLPSSEGEAGPGAGAQVAALLRRSYIYFLSLLQEPPAKWRHVSDAAGVSVTQLLSPDPTLTIYRAEAVFVGVGVWDVFAAVVTPGVRRTWDKNVEACQLVPEGDGGPGLGELSEVWWERRKGQWPVAPRDSVLLRTAYKSPTTVHIFSSSTDDTKLFPSLPPPAPGTIRTQTDLYGWSIEALSPTTTQITLLDQSDPKGWSTKSSWTPQALIHAVAGVRDFAIKRGAPPVVTRLAGAGARKTAEEYDPDRAALRVEYALPSVGDDAPRGSALVECEIRCDAAVWAGAAGVDVVVDPPPLGVSALSRHRLSAGGGLWLTIEHPAALVRAEGRVAVTVRRGGPAGAVSVNGARIKTDVELLDDDKVRELEKRKRVKAPPVPLDQYEALGPRAATATAAAASAARAASLSGGGGAAADGPPAAAGVARAGAKPHAGGTKASTGTADDAPGRGAAAAIAQTAAADAAGTGGAAESVVAAGGVAEPAGASDLCAPAPKAPLDAPACALEALAWLQTFHAEQGPELTDPAPGWAIVSERGGTVVRKKTLARVSETFPVYRGDKIVQGLTADEMASVVTSSGCRKAWDERVESATPLASYGHGITTCAIATKPAFPFKGRIFYVATANAAVKVPSASSGASTSTVLFIASASYTPPAVGDAFDPIKVNPSSLLPGQVLLEGWILETLDPYTSSVLAIPSTRCTYVACVDQKGSVPLALNGVLNANLAKAISAVEQLAKTRGPLPRVWAPSAGLQIEGPLSDDGDTVDFVWRLAPPPAASAATGAGTPVATSQVVAADFDTAEGAFRSLFRIGGRRVPDPQQQVDEAEAALLRAPPARKLSATPGERNGAAKAKPSPLLSPSLPVGSTLLKSELPRSASLSLGTIAPPVLHKPSTVSELSHKTSRSSLRSKSPPAAPSTTTATIGATTATATKNGAAAGASTPAADVVHPSTHDLVVAEIVVDLKQYPHGYAVSATSQLAVTATDEPLSLDALPPRSLAPPTQSASVNGALQIPLRCVAHDAPLPSILTASLDAWKRANHLVRILVPTGAITHPIQDPLRSAEEQTRAHAPPEWYRALSDTSALVEVKVVALPAPTAAVERERALKAKQRGSPQPPPALDGDNGAGAGAAAKVTGQAARSVVFNGEKVVVLSQKESKAVLARFEDDELPLQGAKISRVAPPKRRKASVAPDVEPDRPAPEFLPAELRKPLAVAARLLLPKAVTPVSDDFEFPDPKSPGNVTPAVEEARSPVLGSKKTFGSITGRGDTAFPDAAPATGPLSGLLGTYSRLGSTIMTTTVDVTETTPAGTVAVRRTYTLSFVLLVAIISFLLGSLLRSLLTPADYIIYRPESAAKHADVEHALLQAVDPHRRWRTGKRLVEVRTGWSGLSWDLIVAAVRRE
ncbi:hypothetical protein JCM3770_004146 [Rhodotorula araucariae]